MSCDDHPAVQAEDLSPKEHVIEKHSNGKPKQVFTYAGSDSLNRVETAYHSNGALMSTGEIVSGERHGEWRSFHPDGTPWSIHYYENGTQGGPYRVYWENGVTRIKGHYISGEPSGEWVFFTEEGDTARAINYDQP